MTYHYTKHAERHEARMAEYMRDLPPLERAQREQEEVSMNCKSCDEYDSASCAYCKDEPRISAGMEMQSRREKLYTALEIVGNGSVEAGEELLFKIAERLTHARNKHNAAEWKSFTLRAALTKLQDEVNEQKYASTGESLERTLDEGLDVMAVEIRILNKEFKQHLFYADKGGIL